jgi:oligoendopeptidase F
VAARTVRIHRRDEIPVSDTWDLGQLFRVEEDYQRVLNGVSASYLRYSEFTGYLGWSAVWLADYLEFDASIDRDLEKLTHYASLKKAEDGSEQRMPLAGQNYGILGLGSPNPELLRCPKFKA